MFFKKKKVEDKQQEIVKQQKTENVIEVVLINNKTEKEYTYKSINDFGIDWATVDGWLHLWQLVSNEENSGIAIGAFVDFSIVKVVRISDAVS